VSLFLSTTISNIDKKGRVSIPSGFRTSLTQNAVVLFSSPLHGCLEGFDSSFMDEMSNRLDHFELFSEEQDDLAMSIFGNSMSLTLDENGRVVLPKALAGFANISDKAAFVGMGRKFQIWAPDALEERQAQARKNVQSKKLSIPQKPLVGGV